MFDAYLKQAEETSFSGWNFEYLTQTGRMHETPLPWNYYNVVLPYLRAAGTMLDMGTGGGEVLSRFQPLPPVTCATEQYKPNVAVVREKLETLGVKVFEIEEETEPPFNATLPFENDFFDLVISRHEAYYPPELMRILKSGGTFITQQVGRGLQNIKKLLGGTEPDNSDWNLAFLREELEAAGFGIIEAREAVQTIRFFDAGAVAYWLKAIPWIVEGFNIGGYREKLYELHLFIEERGYYDCSNDIFLLVARKNG